MVEASIWMMALGLTGIISAGVIVAAKVGEWIGDMFARDEPEVEDEFQPPANVREDTAEDTIEDIVRRAAA